VRSACFPYIIILWLLIVLPAIFVDIAVSPYSITRRYEIKFFSAVQSINARNLRVSCGIRNIILAIILRVSLAPFGFRSIIIKAHMVKLSISYLLFRCRAEFSNIVVLVIVIIRIFFIVLFRYFIDTRDRLRFRNIYLRFKIRRLIKRTRYTCGINPFFKISNFS
jgi:hypothetical protein